jgi:hypothetical protein
MVKAILGAAAAALILAGAAAAAPPSVSTSGASSLAPTAAHLNGSVNPNGRRTSWYFQLGTTTSYGTNTAVQNAGSGTKSERESIAVTGLTPGTTYDYRLVASNSSGTSFGPNETFVTLAPPAVQTQTAQSLQTTGATLMGAVDPNGLATTWYFEFGTTTSYGSKTTPETLASGTTVLTVSAPLANLVAGTAYHYRLVATSAAGTAYGADGTFTTAPALTLAAKSLSVVHGNELELSGAVSTGTPGVSVAVLAERYGATSFTQVGTAITRTGGSYAYYARPGIGTTYETSANGGTSQTVAIGVRPSVSLTALREARIQTHVSAGVQLVGRLVQLQRLESGRWVTLKYLHLNTHSTATFTASALPQGRSTIRVALSVNEAGPGLLGGFSREIGYKRR